MARATVLVVLHCLPVVQVMERGLIPWNYSSSVAGGMIVICPVIGWG